MLPSSSTNCRLTWQCNLLFHATLATDEILVSGGCTEVLTQALRLGAQTGPSCLRSHLMPMGIKARQQGHLMETSPATLES